VRNFLMAATLVVPFAVAPAFADMPRNLIAAGDVNLAKTAAGSSAGVASQQGTVAGTRVGGNGAVLTGAVSGNYTR